ncbi:MAG: hypothetical protein WBM32_11410, partial [Crocosphaera sp.]
GWKPAIQANVQFGTKRNIIFPLPFPRKGMETVLVWIQLGVSIFQLSAIRWVSVKNENCYSTGKKLKKLWI